MKIIQQVTEHHCGPAVIEMLLAHLGQTVTQEQVTHAGGAAQSIVVFGMRVDQLMRAVNTLVPDVVFWYKNNASVADLMTLVRDHACPVGVEWQGLFQTDLSEPGEEESDEDPGHYSVVLDIDEQKGLVTIGDPYPDFSDKPRLFTVAEFSERWWDTNEIPDPASGQLIMQRDQHMLFIITPQGVTYPESLGMLRE